VPPRSGGFTGQPELPPEFVERIDGSTATIPMMTSALRLLRGTDAGMKFNTTPYAYDNLIAGTKDVIFVTAPSEDELATAAAAGIELEVIPVVKDALVFLVNADNPVDGLRHKQIQDIYTGKITNWQKVGGRDDPIIAYQRQSNSGSQTLFEQLAMAGKKPAAAPVEHRIEDMAGLVDVISAYDNSGQALGYSVFYYTQAMYYRDNVKLLEVECVPPTVDTIADSTYPYLTYYYAVMRADTPADSLARRLVDWCLSDEGQKTFASASYVPLEQRNVVPPTSGYGYQGSTPENTSQSSGTGGPVGQKAPYDGFEYACITADECLQTDDQGRYLDVSLPQYPVVESAARTWLSEYLSPGDPIPEFLRAYTQRGLLIMEMDHPDGFFEATFRLSDGVKMRLSDFFYDGVNYIEFINQNLLDETNNRHFIPCPAAHEPRCLNRLAPFTGLPADTSDFRMGLDELQGFEFLFVFPPDNPFVSNPTGYAAAVTLNLPNDLSPYGIFWQQQMVRVGNKTTFHFVSDYLAPNPHDDLINEAIDTWVSKQRGAGQYETWAVAGAGRVYFGVGKLLDAMEDSSRHKPVARFDWATGQQLK